MTVPRKCNRRGSAALPYETTIRDTSSTTRLLPEAARPGQARCSHRQAGCSAGNGARHCPQISSSPSCASTISTTCQRLSLNPSATCGLQPGTDRRRPGHRDDPRTRQGPRWPACRAVPRSPSRRQLTTWAFALKGDGRPASTGRQHEHACSAAGQVLRRVMMRGRLKSRLSMMTSARDFGSHLSEVDHLGRLVAVAVQRGPLPRCPRHLSPGRRRGGVPSRGPRRARCGTPSSRCTGGGRAKTESTIRIAPAVGR